jgi:hypothetical protein
MSYADRQPRMDREYLAAWENMSPEQRRELEAAGIQGPLLYRDGTPQKSEDKYEPLANAADQTHGEAESSKVADAVLQVLYILTQSRHPRLRMSAEILTAIIGRTEEKSQAAIARKFGLTRAAVNKHFQNMRKSPGLAGLEVFIFGGRPEVSEACRSRALRVHAQKKKTLCKQAPTAPSLFSQIQQVKAA